MGTAGAAASGLDDRSVVRVLKALADPTRFRMVQEIGAAGEMSCGQVAECFDVSQPTISHHLKILVDAGVLLHRVEGKHRYTAVNHALLDELSGLIPVRLGAAKKPARKAQSK